MGFANFSIKSDLNANERLALKSITRRLSWRGLKMIDLENWEVHGPHSEMNYQVWVGAVEFIKNRNKFHIAICPKKIYKIDGPSDWWKNEEVI